MGQKGIREYSKFKRWRLRQLSVLRGLIRCRPKVIFIHIPKTAGTTVHAHLRACLGSASSGCTLKLREDTQVPQEAVHRAKFVYGHMDWGSTEQLDRAGAFTFTFIRSPQARLRSFYRFVSARALVEDTEFLEPLRGMSAADLAAARHPVLMPFCDNYMVRQLAGNVRHYPVPPHEWPGLLHRAKANLDSLDFVGCQENFEMDFTRLLQQLNLPKAGPLTVMNATPGVDVCRLEIDSALYEWDQKLFESVT